MSVANQNSENAEEVLDVSSENLQALKEESTMVNTDTLMRYIRVFSELSNQLRYSTQKRVMVEIGLIKLCKPAMETGMDSVLDRIRILEEKMEKGIPVMPVPRDMADAMGHGGHPGQVGGAFGYGGDGYAEPEKPKPEKAAPEDLQRIRNNWRSIVGQTEGMFKILLSTAVPKYDGSTGENKLFVEFSNDLAQNIVADPGKKELLETIIAQQTGKSVEVELILKKGKTRQNLAEISVDDILKQAVHTDIVVEEDMSDDEW